MSNEITYRITEFIKKYPPFNFLQEGELLPIAQHSDVKYLSPKTVLFEIGQTPPKQFYIVYKGAIELYQSSGDLVDVCDEGDLFGLRPLMASSPYLLKAISQEETILFCIPTSVFEPYMDRYPAIVRFVATNLAVSAGQKMLASAPSSTSNNSTESTLSELIRIDPPQKPVYCDTQWTIQEAAAQMVRHRVGSMIVCNEAGLPIGIFTDKDLRTKVVAGSIDKHQSVLAIISRPVICVSEGLSLVQLQILMARNRINHVVVTEDGTDQTPIKGIISEHDLVIQQADSPTYLHSTILRADKLEKLKMARSKMNKLVQVYIEKEISMSFITELITLLNDAILVKLIEFSLQNQRWPYAGEPSFSFILLGSMGRREQLLPTDQDHALIFATHPEVSQEALQKYYLGLAEEISSSMAYLGFEYCPGKMMASNPAWCQGLSDWKKAFAQWINTPDENALLMANIFFDFRHLYGDNSLSDALRSFIHDRAHEEQVFLHLMAKVALQNPPPLSFFRSFVVERGGVHKDAFDLKLRAMTPLSDGARVLALAHGFSDVTQTTDRFQRLMELEPQNRDIYQSALQAYHLFMKLRSVHAIQSQSSGRYIKIDHMGKWEKLLLRNAFQAITDIQDILKIRYKL